MSNDLRREKQSPPLLEQVPDLSRVEPPATFHWIEVTSILTCIGLELVVAWELLRGVVMDPPGWVGLAVAFPVAVGAYLGADLVSGLVHFVADSFGSVETPVLGRTFVLPFRSHHAYPEQICQHDFVETNGNNAFATLLLLAPTVAFVPPGVEGETTLFRFFVLVFTVALLLTNQIHKWAHLAAPPPPVRALQRWHVFISPEEHRAHHEPPHGRGYCVTSGFCNAWLDRVGFFTWLERSIRRVLRLVSRRT